MFEKYNIAWMHWSPFHFHLAAASIYVIIALAVKLTSEGPVFYKPYMIGKSAKIFKMYKFRTMICAIPISRIHEELRHQADKGRNRPEGHRWPNAENCI